MALATWTAVAATAAAAVAAALKSSRTLGVAYLMAVLVAGTDTR